MCSEFDHMLYLYSRCYMSACNATFEKIMVYNILMLILNL